MKDVNLATGFKAPEEWEMIRPWEDSLVSHGKDSRLRRLPTGAAKEKALRGGYDAAMLPKCKGEKLLPSGLTFSRFRARV
jgi:hypothetical protein